MAGDRFDLEPSIQALLRDLRISPARVLRRAGLPADLFARGPVTLSTAEYYRFWEALDAEGGERPLAVEIGKAISVEMFSPPLFAALCSPDLATAAQRLAAHKPLIGPLRLDLDTTDGLTISFAWPAGATPPVLLATTELVFWTALARIATREAVRPSRVQIGRPGPHRDAIQAYLGTRLRTADGYSVTFTDADAHRPFLTENDQMWRVFAPDLRRRLSDLEASATVADRVRAALLETLPGGDPSIGGVTTHLATSARTLQRQLSQEGTSFQTLLASTREDLARHYLTRGDLRTSEIAYLLAYDDTNSFYRAFRSWTGTTPHTIRSTATTSA
ncbi:AraC family transcriptional regulator [Nocardioides guangzhouensis]|uniref:AraC family transcriptional regulator n=1 Tax=Nocardioides guangzhouensis TaxID=2497878 RepID=A0A4Q4Z790_9ACTN|nr:AraC family transcriptional regulator [Nocardioides guangzhouensis]RYP83255.1 AraC family transcriptional regulator [Nocardioides guangzhouensis]